ncbi:DNA-binding response regulator [Dehalococcoides mccartyi]|uniref:DNA-binding response regulator n=1 Tax=Dehalococcoides mccartyi TaxID=61435 RepID=A0A2J1DWK5_9CHLR|nr:DNA-binding response regulator [Dehalococcoides mccartyi]
MRKNNILIVDDDPIIIKFVKANFIADGWLVTTASNGQEALRILNQNIPDIIVLDVLMPVMDGMETCIQVRKQSSIPIIMLSAKGSSFDKIQCLKLGADDYLTKPFDIDELTARVESVLRRAGNKNIPRNKDVKCLKCGDISLNLDNRQVTVNKREIKLTPIELALFQELIQNPDKVLDHRYLLSKVWGPEYIQDKAYLHVFISHLRKKIKQSNAKSEYILTIPGIGYMLKPPR